MDDVLVGLLGAVIAVFSIPIVQFLLAQVPDRSKAWRLNDGRICGRIRLPYGLFFSLLAASLLGIAWFALANIPIVTTADTAIAVLLVGGLTVLGVSIGYQVWASRLIVSGAGVWGMRLLGASRFVAWAEVVGVEYQESWWGLCLTTKRGEQVYVPAMFAGFGQCLEALRHNAPDADWCPQALAFARKYLGSLPPHAERAALQGQATNVGAEDRADAQ